MKKIIFLIISTLSFTAFPGVGGSVGGSGGLSSIFTGKRLVTLEDFDGSLSYIVHWPIVVALKIEIPVKNICAEGVVLKTIKPQKYCKTTAVVEICERQGHGSETCRAVRKKENSKESTSLRFVYGCVEYAFKDFETSKFYEASVCARWERNNEIKSNSITYKCVEYKNETKEYEDDYMVSVTTNSNSTHQSGPVEVTKLRYEIPVCVKPDGL